MADSSDRTAIAFARSPKLVVPAITVTGLPPIIDSRCSLRNLKSNARCGHASDNETNLRCYSPREPCKSCMYATVYLSITYDCAIYWFGLDAGVAVELAASEAGGLGTVFFLAVLLVAGFLAGAASSTTVFFTGVAGVTACACCSFVLRFAISFSFVEAKSAMRSAKARRDCSSTFRSLSRDWNSSFEPKAPADSATEPKTS